MKRLLFVTIALSFSAQADTIPPQLTKQLKPLDLIARSLDAGVLRLIFNRPVVSKSMYSGVVYATCTPAILDQKNGWGRAQIDRIEAVNNIGTQGFAVIGGRKTCQDLGRLVQGQRAEIDYMAAHTWVCVAGKCRPRQQGEITSGD